MDKKIFIGPYEIAGYYANLSQSLRKAGLDCDFITYSTHPYSYGGETKTPLLLKIARYFDFPRLKTKLPKSLQILILLPRHILLNFWALCVIFKYDVYIFGFGASLGTYKNWDLIILRWLNKIVISHLNHGSEARPPYIDGFIQEKDGRNYPSINDIISKSSAMRKKIKRIQKYSNIIVGAPLSTSAFVEGRMVNTFALGIPFVGSNTDNFLCLGQSNVLTNEPAKSVRILHSPSHPAGKGTDLIEEAIRRLRQRGYKIEFVKIHGLPNSEVIKEIQCCDFVIDQLYSDFPLAGFATEAAWYGKPAIVGGYGLAYLRSITPAHLWPPSKICHPNEIIQAIEDLIINCDERIRLGKKAQQFVIEEWNPVVFTKRYIQMIEGNIPAEWLFESSSVVYLQGCGQSNEQTQKNIRNIVIQHGIKSLQLSHRPDLEKAFAEFANLNNSQMKNDSYAS